MLKLCFRLLGSLVGLFGLAGLYFSLAFFVPRALATANPIGAGLAAIGLLMSAYLTFVGYLTWWRWSPAAVRHLVGTGAFVLCSFLGHPRGPSSPPYLFLLALLLSYPLYRLAASRCCRRLFPTRPSPA